MALTGNEGHTPPVPTKVAHQQGDGVQAPANAASLDHLSSALRTAYSATLEETIPSSLTDLLDQLR